MASFFNKTNNKSKAKEVLCLKRRLFSLAICLFLFTGLFSVFVTYSQIPVPEGIIEVEIPVRGTFVRAMDDWPYYGPGQKEYDEYQENDNLIRPSNHPDKKDAIIICSANHQGET